MALRPTSSSPMESIMHTFLTTLGVAGLLALSASAASAPVPLQEAATTKPAAKAGAGWHVTRTFELGGEGSWDYLTYDPDGKRLFVSRSTHVMVVDAQTGKAVGDIPDTAGVHGIALAPALGRGFTTNGKSDSVTIFDTKTLATLSTVKVGERPDAIHFEPVTSRVFTFNGKSHDATAIDAASGKVVGTVPLGGKPEAATSDGAGHVFVNIEDKSEVVEFDPKTLAVVARWPLAPGEEPSGMAIDVANHRLFVGCGNKLMVVLDDVSGKVVTTLPIGERVDGNAFDPAKACAFSANGDGTLTVVHEDSPTQFTVLANVPTAAGARTVAIDTEAHRIYLPTARYEAVAEAAAGAKQPRPKMVEGTFKILVVEP
jgi:YVTN family beta-propeller protein